MRSSSSRRSRSASSAFIAAGSARNAEPLLHDRARGRVLQVHLLRRIQVLGDGKGSERRLVKAAQDQFLLAGVVVDVADGEYSRHGGLELRSVDPDRLFFQVEPPLGDRAELRM